MKTLLRLYHEAVNGAKRNFTTGELKMMMDVMPSDYLDPFTIGGSLLAKMENSFALNPGQFEAEWGIEDSKKTIEKLKGLSPFHAACLAIWTNSFRRGNTTDETSNDLNEYLRGPNIAGALQNALHYLTISIDLQEKTRGAFKSKTIAEARDHAEKALAILEPLI